MFGPVPILTTAAGQQPRRFPYRIDRFKLVDSDHFRKD